MDKQTIHENNTPSYLKSKAEKALKAAKDLEIQQMLAGKKFVQLNDKTIVLR
jgi:hypothetical protein